MGSLRPVHGTPGCQLHTSARPVTPLPPPKPCTHMALEDCPPRTKEWGLLWRTGKQTFLFQWSEWPQVQLGHFKLCYTRTRRAWRQSRSSAFE